MSKLGNLAIVEFQCDTHQWYENIYFNSYREATEYLLSQGYVFDIEFMN